jgi:murein DD-endopeptidase MepM/ murein hydrolase activator NlpD
VRAIFWPTVRRRLWVPLLGTLILLSGTVVDARPATADELSSAKARANAAAAELGRAESALGRLEGQINDLEARKADAEQRLDTLRIAAQQVVIRRFINADATQVSELDPDINNQARADALSRYATQGNQDAIDAYTAAQEDLEVAEKALTSKRASAKAAVEQLDEKRAAALKELARLQEIEAKRKKTARQTAAARGRAPAGPIATGAWVCPVQGAVSFIDSYGAPRSGGRAHKGVDMLAARGTPTVAPVGGTVTHRGNGIGGLSWHLNGDDGNYYYGTHLQSYANQGAGHVQAGTVIGYVGDTGNAAGTPHLHFEIHPNGGGAVNPYPTVRKYC